MPTTTGAFSALLAPGLRKIFTDEYKDWPEEYSKILTSFSSKKAYEDELITAGLGRYDRKEESTSITYDDPTQGSTVRYTHLAYAKGFRISREMYDDDLYGVMKKMSRQLAQSARLSVEYEVGALIDDIFSGSTYTGQDSKALCARDHALVGTGGTYANEPAAQIDLSITGLRNAMIRMEKTPNERGLLKMIMPKMVVVSPTYQWIADEILGTTGKAYTADNTKNAFDKFGLTYMVYHFQSDEDQWLLLADKAQHDMKFFWRQKAVFENSDDFDNKDAKFSGFMRFSFGFTDWRGVDGSSGAA